MDITPSDDKTTATSSSKITNFKSEIDQSTPQISRKVKILFLAANPKDTSRLRLGEEIREIEEKISLAQKKEFFILLNKGAVRTGDLQRYLNLEKPNIVHFSSHGTDKGEIVLEDNLGNATPVSAKALGRVFKILRDDIRCVVLNACFSREQAKAISQHIDCVIGMTSSISDQAAIVFSAAFYLAIASERDLQNAFDQGINELMLKNIQEEHSPELLIRNNIDPQKIFLFKEKRQSAITSPSTQKHKLVITNLKMEPAKGDLKVSFEVWNKGKAVTKLSSIEGIAFDNKGNEIPPRAREPGELIAIGKRKTISLNFKNYDENYDEIVIIKKYNEQTEQETFKTSNFVKIDKSVDHIIASSLKVGMPEVIEKQEENDEINESKVPSTYTPQTVSQFPIMSVELRTFEWGMNGSKIADLDKINGALVTLIPPDEIEVVNNNLFRFNCGYMEYCAEKVQDPIYIHHYLKFYFDYDITKNKKIDAIIDKLAQIIEFRRIIFTFSNKIKFNYLVEVCNKKDLINTYDSYTKTLKINIPKEFQNSSEIRLKGNKNKNIIEFDLCRVVQKDSIWQRTDKKIYDRINPKSVLKFFKLVNKLSLL